MNPGHTATVYLWAQPQTFDAGQLIEVTPGGPYNVLPGGAYHPTTNPFRQLVGLSLDLVSVGSAQVASIYLENPRADSQPFSDLDARFQILVDSAHQQTVNSDLGSISYPNPANGGLEGVLAFRSVSPISQAGAAASTVAPSTAGIGALCTPVDGCVTGAGGPAWRLGRVEVHVPFSSQPGLGEVRLQVGASGMSHVGEIVDLNLTDGVPGVLQYATLASFGTSGGPIYNTQDALHRGVSLSNDTADIRVAILAPRTGDYNGNGLIDAADYTYYRDRYGTSFTLPNRTVGLTGSIGPLDLAAWQANYGRTLGSPSVSVPEPASVFVICGVALLALVGSKQRFPLAMIALALMSPNNATATIWWDSNESGTQPYAWGNPANWSIGSSGGSDPSPFPDDTDVEFNIAAYNSLNRTINLSTGVYDVGTRFANSLAFGSSGTTTIQSGSRSNVNNNPAVLGLRGDAWRFSLNAEGRVVVANQPGSGTERVGLYVESGAGPVLITAPIRIRGSQTWANNGVGGMSVQGNVDLQNFILNVRGGGSTGITGTISGLGRIEKTGSGDLTLTANNTYAGGTFLSGGNLFVSADAQLGSGLLRFDGNGNGSLGLNGSFSTSRPMEIVSTGQIDTRGHTLTWNGSISGGARLTKSNLGTLVLNGPNSSFGGLTINGGTVQGNSSSIPTSGSIIVNNGARLDVLAGGVYGAPGQSLELNSSALNNVAPNVAESIWQGNLALTGPSWSSGMQINGNVTGTGGLTTYWTTRLIGANSYTGGTNNQGLLVGNTNGLQGRIDNFASLVFEQGFSDAFRGEIYGPGTFYKDGAGILTINSAIENPMVVRGESIAGSAGTLRNSIHLNPNTAVRFTQTTPEGFNFPITGQGGVTVNGGSRLDLNHTGNNFSGGLGVIASTVGGNGSTLGTGPITLHGSNLEITSQATVSNAITISQTSEIRTGANNIQLSGNLSGGGTLIKRGSGYIWLTGNNSGWSGGASVREGSLYFSSDNHFGSGSVTLDGGGIIPWASTNGSNLALSRPLVVGASGGTINTNTHTLTYSGVLSGSGTLRKDGAGTLYLTSSNTSGFTGNYHLRGGTFTVGAGLSLGASNGSITLDGGILNLGQNVTAAKSVNVVGPSTVVTEGFNSTLSGAIGGTGSLIKDGGGDLLLSGSNNNFTGGTVVNGGRLFPRTGSLGSGPLTFNGGTIYFGITSASGNPFSASNDVVLNADASGGTLYTYGNNATLSGNISGPGGLRKGGFGKLILTGANSYQGNTHVVQHEVRGNTNSIRNNVIVDASTSIEFDQGFDGTFSGNINGPGALTKLGTGTLTLTSTSSGVGGVYVNAGKLAINGSITGPVTVNASGALGGSGVIGGSVTGPGRVAPGNSPGILTINGDYTQSPTSVLEIEIGGLTPGSNANQHDQVRVGGLATLDGRYEFSLVNGFTPQIGQSITFIDTFDPDGGGPLLKGQVAINTRPREAVLPGLPAGVAFQVESDTLNDQVRLNFVDENDIYLTYASDSTPWFVATGKPWLDGSPTPVSRDPLESDRTFVRNITGQPQEVRLNSPDPDTGPLEEINRLYVSDDAAAIKLGVDSGYRLLVRAGEVEVGSLGTVELNGGTLDVPGVSPVTVKNGGQFTGNGNLIGSLSAGEEGEGIVAPGIGSAVGTLNVSGNYTQGAGGVYEVNIMGASGNNDFVDVTGNLVLGDALNPGDNAGTLRIDLSTVANPMSLLGEEYVIAEAASVQGKFSDVEIVGGKNVYLRVVYPEAGPATASEGEIAAVQTREVVKLLPTMKGDIIVGDGEAGVIDEKDAAALSAVLLSGPRLLQVEGVILDENTIRGALDFVRSPFETTSDTRIDFSDVPYFAAAMAQSQSISYAQAMATFERVFEEVYLASVPEPTSSALTLIGLGYLLRKARGRRA